MCNNITVEELSKWRHFFHRHPELSNEEKHTSQMLAAELEKMNIPYQTFADNFGLCAVIKGETSGPTIAFRTDMDALPIAEENKTDYTSENVGVMHACGHDGHMTIALGLAKLFMNSRKKLAGTIKIIFQPAEENSPTGGASRIMDSGILNDVSAIYGLHVWPDLPCGEIGVHIGPMMAASDRMKIELYGKASHAAKPQYGIDAITMAADVIEGIGHIASRQISPLAVATISIGTLHCGERYNVVARKAVLEGTVRTLDKEVREEIPKKIVRLLKGTSEAYGGSYKLDYQWGYPIVNNWPEPTKLLIAAAQKVIGGKNVHTDIQPDLTAEDFSHYLEKMPGAFFWLGCKKEGNYGALHTPNFDMDERALVSGVKIFYQTGLAALAYYKE